jgi:hypothetical protein
VKFLVVKAIAGQPLLLTIILLHTKNRWWNGRGFLVKDVLV